MYKMSFKKVEELVDQLSIREKIQLSQKLDQETLDSRWDALLKRIDQRLKKYPITQKEINEEIQAYRKEKHAQGRG